MRLWQRCLRISLLLNLALAAVAIVLAKQRSSTEVKTAVTPTVVIAPANKTTLAITNRVFLTNSIQWSQIESTDFPTYIANLRRIGCPEKTIADIIIADVEELYERRRALVPLEARFWESDAHSWRAKQKRVDEQIRLENEKTLLLRQLLNITWFDYAREDPYDVSLMQFFSGVLEPEKATQILSRSQRLKEDRQLLEKACLSIDLPEDGKRKEELLEDYRRDVLTLLTPAEVQEMKERGVLGNVIDKTEFFSVIGITGIESKQIAKLAVDAMPEQNLVTPVFDESNRESRDLLFTNEMFRAQVRQLLGPSRYALFELATAEHFDAIYRSVNNCALPRETAFELTRLTIAAEENAKQLRENSDLSIDNRAAGLKAIRQSLEQSMGSLVGTNRDHFIHDSEWWLKELEAAK